MKAAFAFLTSPTGRRFWSVHLPVLALIIGVLLVIEGAINDVVFWFIAAASVVAFIAGAAYSMRTMGRRD